jgi:polyisoprenoid-binding protein YceI
MPRFAFRPALAVLMFALAMIASPAVFAADNYKVDPVHSTSVFRIKHANIAWFWGRFTEPTGSFTLDEADPSKSSFRIELLADKVDSANPKRDAHLKSPDFFNAKQFPKITFKSTSVAKGEGENMLAVTGDLTMHGVTKSVTVPVEISGKGQFMNTPRAGVEATLTVKMSDFQIKGMPGALSDEVKVVVSLEGAKEK